MKYRLCGVISHRAVIIMKCPWHHIPEGSYVNISITVGKCPQYWTVKIYRMSKNVTGKKVTYTHTVLKGNWKTSFLYPVHGQYVFHLMPSIHWEDISLCQMVNGIYLLWLLELWLMPQLPEDKLNFNLMDVTPVSFE